MREEFFGASGKSLIVDDKSLTLKTDPEKGTTVANKNELRNCYCPFGSIVSISFFIGVLSVNFKVDEQICGLAFAPNKADKSRIKETVNFVKSAMKTAPKESAINLDKEAVHKMYCDTCKNIYCYTDDDIRLNKLYSQRAGQERALEVTSALGGTRIETQMHSNQSQSYTDKIVDHKKCPHCGSTCVREVTDTEYEQLTNNTSTLSAADELKKLKELLDMDIITQEEFDAKKKQLLGL